MNKSKHKIYLLFFAILFTSLINISCGEEQVDAPPVVKPVKVKLLFLHRLKQEKKF